MRKIILASGSPRRKQLLQQLIGTNFEIRESSYEEDNQLDMEPVKLAIYHSLNKARDAAKHYKDGIIISADTFVVYNNKVLGKPRTEKKSREMLQLVSGRVVEVVSGITVIDINNKKELTESEITKVKMKDMTQKEIEEYIMTGEPLDKAGAFGAQDRGCVFVEKVEGCYNNVVGLPLFRLNKMLEQLGVNVLKW